MIRAIIFDFYGVLAINGWQAFKEKHFADREQVWDQVYRIGRQVDAGLSDYAELVRFTAEATGESEATVRYQLEHTIANTELLDFIAENLQGRYRLGILSNTSNDEVFAHILTREQLGLFAEALASRRLGLVKPDVRAYEEIANRMGVELGECLFVDDREHHVAGAREAGMRALLFTDVADLKRALTEFE
jgi:putative hydrolase of the HAD superfamily